MGDVPDRRRAEPASHQVGRRGRRQKLELIVTPLHAKGVKGPEGAAPTAGVPAAGESEVRPVAQELIAEQNHMQHNFLSMSLDKDPQDEIVSASHEGLIAWKRGKDGTYAKTVIGEGSQAKSSSDASAVDGCSPPSIRGMAPV